MDGIMLILCGLFSFGFAIYHARFWHIFKWKSELLKLDEMNRGMIEISNLKLIYFFLFVSAVCFLFPQQLLNTGLGHFFLGGMSVFWLVRAIEQFILMRIDHPMMHLLAYLLLIGSILFAVPLLL